MGDRKQFMTVIDSKPRLLNIPVQEIVKYKDLIFTLVKRNYKIQYKQTILGPFWLVFGLIVNTGIFSLIFGYIGNFSSDGVPYVLFYLTGTMGWDYFSGCFGHNKNVFKDNAYIMGKVYFPRLVVPISNMVYELIRVGVKLIVTIIVWIFFFSRGEALFMGWWILLLIPTIFLCGLTGTAFGMIISSLTTKYRDFSHLTGALMSIMMYASPILYSVSDAPEWLKTVVHINPISAYIEMIRYSITGTGNINPWAVLYSILFTAILAFVAVIKYNQTEKTFIDIV